ncbi:MAG: ATP synthase F1 subunit gamma [Planctomycetota bacterium]
MGANIKAIRMRIKSVASTKKITKTMEMVATSKLKRAQDAVTSSRPYAELLGSMMAEVATRAKGSTDFPLLRTSDNPTRTLMFVLTANRGLCGAFNTNLVRKARQVLKEEQDAGRTVITYMAGKKGNSAYRFLGIPVERKYVELSDKPNYAEAEEIAEALTGPFLAGEVDRVLIVYPDFISLGKQPPSVLQLCPVGGEATAADAADDEETATSGDADILFKPDPRTILEKLLPLYVRTSVYRTLIAAVASEQIARRTAMKLASDNAEELVTSLTRSYNKARQAMITQEIAEIISGSAAIQG